MKKILALAEDFLRKYPSPVSATRSGDLLKLNYTFSSPYTDSKNQKQILMPLSSILPGSVHQSTATTLVHNDKGRIEESQSFDSVLVKDKHEKLMQDHCFGKAEKNNDGNRWIYIAEVKPEPVKSYFNQGKGKKSFAYDFGEGYEGVKEAGIFLWDKTTKKVHRVQIEKDLIPAHVSFANSEGSQLIFHAYKRQNFGHGILHCLNRPVGIYHAKLSFKQKEDNKQQKKSEELKLETEMTQLVKDKHQTNIFPRLSPCFNYLVYLSGKGITHTYYLDLVIAKKAEGEWRQTHRLKQKIVGFYDTLKNYIIQQQGKIYAIFQNPVQSETHIFKLDLDTGEQINLTQKYKHHDFVIDDVETDGFMTGVVTTNNFHTFFYNRKEEIVLVEPQKKERFIVKDYQSPIPAMLIYAKEEDIEAEFRERAKKRPVVLMVHGGPHCSFLSAHTCLRYTLLKMGYALLMPNFPGSTGYGQEYLNSLVKGIGEKDVKPILELLSVILTENEDLDKSKVHVYGGSYGGYLSALMGSRHSPLFKSAIILNGVLSNGGELWFTDIPQWVTAQTLGKSELHNLTEEDYAQMWRQSSARDPMKIPTLQFLGAKDLRVPYRQGLFFDAITKEVGTPITTYVYENSNHSLADSVETSIDIIVKTVAFLEEIKDQEK